MSTEKEGLGTPCPPSKLPGMFFQSDGSKEIRTPGRKSLPLPTPASRSFQLFVVFDERDEKAHIIKYSEKVFAINTISR